MKVVGNQQWSPYLGLELVTVFHERGIPCSRLSLPGDEYVPALCTHRPSLLPIGWLDETRGSLFTGKSGLNLAI